MEAWKDIDGYEGLYQVSNYGNVKRLKGYQATEERILKKINNGAGYLSVTLSLNSKKNRYYIHRLVAINFLQNKENKEEVNHIDGDRSNNKLENLEWVTRSENHNHRYQVLNQKGVNYGKTGYLNWRSKKVKQIDLDDNIICIHAGVMEAMRITGVNEANIRGVCYGRQKTAGGFKWLYV